MWHPMKPAPTLIFDHNRPSFVQTGEPTQPGGHCAAPFIGVYEMTTRYQYVPNRVIDQNGIADGASIFFYESGTTTPIAIFSDGAATLPIANPVVVATGAAVPNVYWTFSGNVRVRVVSDDGSVPQDVDPYSALETDLSSSVVGKGAALVGTANGGTVADLLRFMRTEDFRAYLGYDPVAQQPAAIRIGGLSAFSGQEGVLQLGGAGPKDGDNGSFFGCLGHANWTALQPATARNPIELNLYGNSTSGRGDSSGTTTFVSAAEPFTAADVGRGIWIGGVAYTVSAFVDSLTVTLNAAPPAGEKSWHIVVTTGKGTCAVAGGVVTRTRGDPFIPFFSDPNFKFTLDGTAYTVSSNTGPDQYTIASPPADGTYSYTFEININDQISSIRIGPQFSGLNEENMTLMCRTTGYEIRSLYGGAGEYRNILLGSGEAGPGNLVNQINIVSDGNLQLMPDHDRRVSVGGTGNFTRTFDVSSAAGNFASLRLQTSLSPRWDIAKTNGAESGDNAGSDFAINSFGDDGSFLRSVLFITRSNGHAAFHSLGMQAALVDATNDATAAAAGVPLNGFYRTGGFVRQRLT